MPNPFADLIDLPDKPRLGVRPIILGVFIGAARFMWPRVFPSSFQSASAAVFHFFRGLQLHHLSRYASQSDLSELLLGTAACFIVAGAFIFVRRNL
jgi:hypothetical protein